MPYLTGSNGATNGFICRRLVIPNDFDIIIAVNGAVKELTRLYNWELFGSLSPAETIELMEAMYYEYESSDACMIGAIVPFATVDAPPSCLVCDGGVYDRVDYPRLYDALLPIYQISADQFEVPDLRDRFMVAAGLTYDPVDTGGESEHTLIVDEIPGHDHTTDPHTHTDSGHVHSEIAAVASVINGGLEAPAPAATPSPASTGAASANLTSETVTVNSTGGGQPHNNLPPYYALRFAIVAR